MVSKRRPSSTASRRKSKALAVTTSTFRKPLRSTLPAERLAGLLGDLHRGHPRRPGRELQREAAEVGEAVQRLAPRVARRELVVLALVEEGAGLLAGLHVGRHAHQPLGVLDSLRDLAPQHRPPRLEPLQRPDVHVGAVHHPARAGTARPGDRSGARAAPPWPGSGTGPRARRRTGPPPGPGGGRPRRGPRGRCSRPGRAHGARRRPGRCGRRTAPGRPRRPRTTSSAARSSTSTSRSAFPRNQPRGSTTRTTSPPDERRERRESPPGKSTDGPACQRSAPARRESDLRHSIRTGGRRRRQRSLGARAASGRAGRSVGTSRRRHGRHGGD